MFEHAGMEVYETIRAVEVPEQPIAVSDGGKVQSLLELREIEEQLHRQLYSVHEIMEERQLSEDNRRIVATGWLDHVRTTFSSLVNIKLEEIVERNRPWEL